MKLQYKSLSTVKKESVIARMVAEPCFDESWHFHPEIELVYVVKSTGKRFVGNNVTNFREGDFVLIGPNLPHLWRNDENYLLPEYLNQVELIIIQFDELILSQNFWDIPEASLIKKMIDYSPQGISFSGQTQFSLLKELKNLVRSHGIKRILLLVDILDKLSKIEEFELISSPGFTNSYKKSEQARMNNIIKFVMDHYKYTICLNEIAKVANMEPNAFCRYFKKRTKKTFFGFLNELRISNACKLLIQGNWNISEVCYQSGYNTLSYFNRKFKSIVGISPSEYKQKYSV